MLVDVISTSTSSCVKLNLAYLAYSVYFLTDSQLNENLLSGPTIVKTVAKFPGVHFRFCLILKQDDDLIKIVRIKRHAKSHNIFNLYEHLGSGVELLVYYYFLSRKTTDMISKRSSINSKTMAIAIPR